MINHAAAVYESSTAMLVSQSPDTLRKIFRNALINAKTMRDIAFEEIDLEFGVQQKDGKNV
jgi:hypothetical protein